MTMRSSPTEETKTEEKNTNPPVTRLLVSVSDAAPCQSSPRLFTESSYYQNEPCADVFRGYEVSFFGEMLPGLPP